MILVNGVEQEQIEVTDRGLHYGDGLFETIAIVNGRPQLWQAHMERLLEGCHRLGIPLPDVAQLAAEAAAVCVGSGRAVLKIIITRGSGGRGYLPPADAQPSRLLFCYPWPAHADDAAPITLRLCRTPLSCNPALAGIKHLNRLEQVLARQEWDEASIGEGLMCDPSGHLIEGTMSNLFVVRAGELLTPDLSECGVAGVMRRQVLALADALLLSVRVTRLAVAEVEAADEVFITNSVLGIRPVSRFETVQYHDNPLTRRLQSALRERLEREYA
ncbi:MAG: aminodeoxychorismate lyase [Gammaproteobacteria bacterium]|nr:aminodeoxychorismate lyase [Gammaproteobacteria bacterium]MCW9088454.1 aminodeoxychorismate lyase [Gammaproteobacteria bacterium]